MVVSMVGVGGSFVSAVVLEVELEVLDVLEELELELVWSSSPSALTLLTTVKQKNANAMAMARTIAMTLLVLVLVITNVSFVCLQVPGGTEYYN